MWCGALGNCQDEATCFTTLWLCVGKEGLEMGQCHCLASGGLLSIHPISSHFTHFLYVTGTLPAVALGVDPRVGGFAYVLSPCGSFKQSLLKIQQFLLPPQAPLGTFTTRSYGNLSFPVLEPWAVWSAWGWDCWLPRCPS